MARGCCGLACLLGIGVGLALPAVGRADSVPLVDLSSDPWFVNWSAAAAAGLHGRRHRQLGRLRRRADRVRRQGRQAPRAPGARRRLRPRRRVLAGLPAHDRVRRRVGARQPVVLRRQPVAQPLRRDVRRTCTSPPGTTGAARSGPVPRAWAIAFDAADRRKATGTGNLLLGMSAHVNRDLPFTLYSIGLVAPDGSSRKADHDRVNEILNAVITPLIDEVAQHYDPSVRMVPGSARPRTSWSSRRCRCGASRRGATPSGSPRRRTPPRARSWPPRSRSTRPTSPRPCSRRRATCRRSRARRRATPTAPRTSPLDLDPTRSRDDGGMALARYGVLKATVLDRQPATGASPHYQLLCGVDDARWRIAINARSQQAPSEVAYAVVSPFAHPIVAMAEALADGWRELPERTAAGGGLDLIRGNLCQPEDFKPLPISAPGPGNDLDELFDFHLRPLIGDPDAAGLRVRAVLGARGRRRPVLRLQARPGRARHPPEPGQLRPVHGRRRRLAGRRPARARRRHAGLRSCCASSRRRGTPTTRPATRFPASRPSPSPSRASRWRPRAC